MNSQSKSTHKALGLLLVAFIAPVVIAKLVLSLNLYHGGATNFGELINPATSYTSLGVTNPKPKEWQLLYLLPSQCDDNCRERLYILRQSHTALGPDQARVEPLILVSPESDINALKAFHFNTSPINNSLNEWLNAQQLIIVDPLGNLVLRYPQAHSKEAHLAQGKALIADLRKLLRLSRVD